MPISNKKLLPALTLIILLTSPAVAQVSNSKSSLTCSSKIGAVELKWTKVSNIRSLKLPGKIGSARLPKAFTVFTVNPALLKKYMMDLKKNGGAIVLPAPEPNGCVNFSVMNSGTMSPQLAAKFPELVSMKGTAATDKTATVRLDYDGVQLSAEMYFSGVPYNISSWKKGTTLYYLLYKKEDSGVDRKPLSE